MKTDQEIIAYIRSHPATIASRIAHNLGAHGVTGERVRALWAVAKQADAPATVHTAPKPPVRVKPKTMDDFRRAFDNPQKIRNGLSALAEGAYFTEEEFRVFCNIPQQLWRRNAELSEFSDNHLKVAGVVHWGRKGTIQEMKTIVGSA